MMDKKNNPALLSNGLLRRKHFYTANTTACNGQPVFKEKKFVVKTKYQSTCITLKKKITRLAYKKQNTLK